MQSATQYPIAASNTEHDIIRAAERRAAFWEYPIQGPWTVPVMVAKREVRVHRDTRGITTIDRGGSK